MFIYSWNANSEGAKALKEALGAKKIKNEGSLFKGHPNKTVINWGSSTVPNEVLKCNIINHPDKVKVTADKLKFFKTVEGEEWVPPFTTFYETALEWVAAGKIVFARKILNGHSGAGIVLMRKDEPENFTKAPLFVEYIPKVEEYRVHVIFGKVVDVQRKTLSKDKAEELKAKGLEPNFKIRNLENGFIYQRSNINPSQAILDASLAAVKKIGLDFGAVDIVAHKVNGKPYVLEINSAPGLVGTTIESYKNAFKK